MDKKQSMCLRAKLSGDGVEDVLITKYINVQQSPGRGAKVVPPARISVKQSRVIESKKADGQRIIHLKTRFVLGKGVGMMLVDYCGLLSYMSKTQDFSP